MEIFLQADTWGALVTLTFLEIVLGIDNIIFISIAANKLPENEQKKATNIGLFLAMVLRIVLLFGISLLIAMNSPLFNVDLSWFKAGVTGQSLILFAGGLFLLYKSTKEIHHKVEGLDEHSVDQKPKKKYTISQAIVQITLINIVFSFDSILTAVGMTNGVEGAMIIMVVSVILSMIIMMLFANPVGKFVNKHPTIQMLGLSFLILIGFMLIAEAAHLSHAKLFGEEMGIVPKGYLYFAITFSLVVEMLNMRMRRKKTSK
ncbi:MULTISPECIES: TerC family protein [unclassified Tenacibaculum]|uniref:TerC family protein n=1 Tax=Tenacibaculum TaxID=104267 RepID=UPI000895956A|nr:MULTISPECIES: TerC family protein [unclassified Tenacibaculum]RBW56339.1 TerC family protein [Tenacibaculum sp. E3R01]SEE46226.1 Membrane protein TerC, possibly involved in tellurium resistance [Tenacibaculum sp. MAR_2010_89]